MFQRAESCLLYCAHKFAPIDCLICHTNQRFSECRYLTCTLNGVITNTSSQPAGVRMLWVWLAPRKGRCMFKNLAKILSGPHASVGILYLSPVIQTSLVVLAPILISFEKKIRSLKVKAEVTLEIPSHTCRCVTCIMTLRSSKRNGIVSHTS